MGRNKFMTQMKIKDQERAIERIRKINIELNESMRSLEEQISILEKQLAENESVYRGYLTELYARERELRLLIEEE